MPAIKNNHTSDIAISKVMETVVSDIEFSTVMDTAFAGRFAMTPELHSHAYFELHAAISGEYCIDFQSGEPVSMKPPMICLIPPNCYHGTYSLTDGAQKLALRFSYHKATGEDRTASLFSDFHAAMRQLTEPVIMSGELICELMITIRNELLSKNPTSELLVSSLIQQLYIFLFRLTVPQPSQHSPATVEDGSNLRYYLIETYFSERYSQNITEEDLARELNLSKRQLSRILRSVFGMSFRDKLIETRMQKAAKLLEITDIPIVQIAYNVGYSSPSGFRITFKRIFGMSGEEYRKNVKKNILP